MPKPNDNANLTGTENEVARVGVEVGSLNSKATERGFTYFAVSTQALFSSKPNDASVQSAIQTGLWYMRLSCSREQLIREQPAARPAALHAKSAAVQAHELRNMPADAIVPIRLDIAVDQQRFQDTFCWHSSETPEAETFATTLCQDNGLRSAVVPAILSAIQQQGEACASCHDAASSDAQPAERGEIMK